MNLSIIAEIYDDCSGILLMGGKDVNPEVYTSKSHIETNPGSRAQTDMEIKLIQKSLIDKKPLLGICRGYQLMAVSTGESLYQHIPDIESEEKHNATDNKYDSLLFDPKHKVFIDENTKFSLL